MLTKQKTPTEDHTIRKPSIQTCLAKTFNWRENPKDGSKIIEKDEFFR